MLSISKRGSPEFGIRSLWIPLYWMDRDPETFVPVWGPSDDHGGGLGLYDPPSVDEHFLTRLGVSLRVWLRRAIKRINDRTVARVGGEKHMCDVLYRRDCKR